jgi:lysozyme
MELSPAGLKLIEQFEGCRLEAYQDSGGVWTIGYGHTIEVSGGMTCTQDRADQWLQEDSQRAVDCVGENVHIDLTQHQFDALVSFTYNVGCGNFASSTLLKKLNGGDVEGAAEQFERWCKVKGQVVAGLLRRRQAEKAMFLEA